jgi:hypothetical protein
VGAGGTPAGSYSLTIAATLISGPTTLTHTANITLVVK